MAESTGKGRCRTSRAVIYRHLGESDKDDVDLSGLAGVRMFELGNSRASAWA